MTSRFRALNVEVSDESDNETEATSTTTKEALEEKATALYMGALELQGNEKWDEAEELYRLLLNSELLSDVCGKVQFINGRIKPSLEHLKYSVCQNLGHVLVAKKQLQEGLDLYKKALELDDTDLNLWYKIGLTGMKLVDLNVAISAFQVVLEMNPRHFPSLDNIITATYAQGGLLMCLHYIARALQYNHKYKKGLALKDRIFRDHPSMKEHYVVFDPYPNHKFSTSEEVGLDAEAAQKWYQEVVDLRAAEAELAASEKQKKRETEEFTIPCRPTTWLQLSLIILTTHLQFTDEAPQLDFFRPVKLITDVPFSDEDMQIVRCCEQGLADEDLDHGKAEGAHDYDDVEPCAVRGKRRRSSPTPMEQLGATKRRSTRARNTARKEEPTLARALTALLPTSLLLEGKEENEAVHLNDDSMDTMDMYQLFANKDSGEVQELELINNLSDDERNKIIKKEEYFNTEKETGDVNKFLESYNESDILTLLDKVIFELAEKWDKHWPNLLPATYVQLYNTYLKHNPPVTSIPSLLKSEVEGWACVLFGEFLLDQWLLHGKSRNALSPLAGSCFGGEFPSLLLGDLFDLSTQTSNSEFFVRIFWMHALFSLYNDEVTTAINKLNIIQESEHLNKVDIHLVNVTHHFIVRKSTVEGMLSTLNRKQMVDELTDLYQQDDCEQIVAILTEVLKPSKFGSSLLQSALDRDAQYSLLLYTLWRLDKYNECLHWSEMFVHESVTQLLAAVAEDNEELKCKWLCIIHNTILCILTCLNYCGNHILNSLEKNKLSRLVQSLSHVICRQIEIGQVPESEFDIISPWMLLYEIITQCEKDAELASGGTPEERLPSSIRLLFTAHEYLGRREWCCFDEGVILYQTLYQLQTLMDLYHPETEEYSVLLQQLEQILYCLYGHPMKRNKPRYVQEHNTNGLELTWARSHQVLSLLRPKELPTFDSTSKCSITADTEALFRRITQLVPQEKKPDKFVEQMTSYIEGNVDVIPQNDNPLPQEMADIYYLIADHYFKNKTWSKALKFYILDVCNNPERVDSWACLALARGSMLETKINSCDPLKSKSDFLKKAMMSCRCYKTSLDLDSALPTLWIEYGSFSYMVHSFCSRLLKQEQNLSLEMFDFLETQKESMIQKSLSCFTFANKLWYTEDGQEMQDERWLHHYMLGKISEKKQKPLSQCISHYLRSMEFLHLNNAMYPSLVTYNTPQYLAVEALELYYRTHAVILKTLEQSEEKPVDPETRKLFKDTLDKLSNGPFAQKVTRNEGEGVGVNPAKKTVYIDSEETRIATVKRLMDSLLEQVEATVGAEQSKKAASGKRGSVSADSQPAKRVKREDSASKGVRTSTESSSDSDSDSDSSSNDSSGSSSDDSEETSDEEKSNNEKGDKKQSEKSDSDWKKEQEALISRCLEAFEDCARRFPEHYKSLYRLAHFYFRSKASRNVDKARQLLLGESGLFANRKASNFFNGVWRIPSNEIDRPGSFASHMSRCVLLLVDILRHTRDHKLLFDLALQLRDTPDSDKKYLRDPERDELSAEALSLSVQALRCKISEAKTAEEHKSVLLEAFKVYKSCNKLWEHKVSQFSVMLGDAYTQFKKEEGTRGDLLDAAIKYCTQELATQKAAAAVSTPSSASHSAFSSPDVSQTPSPVLLVPPIPVQQRPPLKTNVPVKRGRGRPPNSTIRHQNPSSLKASQQKTSAEDLAQMYRNLFALQMLNQGKSQESLNQAVINQALMNPALTQQMMQFTQQINFHNDYIRKQVLIQQQLQNIKDSKANVSTIPPVQKNDATISKSMSAVNSLLAPSKVSVFSSQSVLPPSNTSKLPIKPQNSLSISPIPSSSSSTTSIFQQGVQAQYLQTRNVTTPKQNHFKASPFQQKISTEPKVSLQHKLLSAKTSKSQMSAVSITPSLDKGKIPKDKKSSTTLSTASLTSRGISITPSGVSITPSGVSITPSKPPEIKIPKDITIGQGLSISPVSSISPKTKSALSPSTSKEVTLTILKTQSEVKIVKPGSSLSVTLKDSKKPQLNPGTGKERNSPTPTIRMGSGVSILPAKSAKQPPAKPIPKADFSITIAKGDEKKKKEDSSGKVIVID